MHLFQQVDFKAKTHNLKDLLFEVKSVDLVTQTKDLFNNDLNGLIVKNYVALMNTESKEVLCVVSDQYQLFTNQQALEFGKQAFVDLFPSVKKEELIIFKVISSLRKTFCHIDLVHQDVNFNAWEQETWFPFLRVTNSYNRKCKFSLELGFVRKVCSNGMIFDKQTIKIKYSHTKGMIPVSIKADVSKLKELENEFKAYLLNLKRFHVKKTLAFPIVCKALNLNWKLNEKQLNYENELNVIHKLKAKTNELSAVYMGSYGETAFAIMNVLTDLVSHNDNYGVIPRYNLFANDYYHRISSWMREFCDAAEKRDFDIERYLGDFLNYNKN